MTSANNFIAINFPANTRKRPGWRTKILRNVPYVYSCAVCAAKTQSAIIPRKPPTLLKPCTPPVASARTSRLTVRPRSEFPSGESMSKKRREENSALKKTTAPMVPRKSVGRRNLRSSDNATFHIISHPSFQKMSLQDLVAEELAVKALCQHRRRLC